MPSLAPRRHSDARPPHARPPRDTRRRSLCSPVAVPSSPSAPPPCLLTARCLHVRRRSCLHVRCLCRRAGHRAPRRACARAR
eukprot:6177511-Pleurochrysis_carterae.AAC.1